MKYKIFLAISIIVIGCSSPKVIVNYKADAEQLEQQGKYDEALVAWKSFMVNKDLAEIDAGIYAQAAKTAHKAGMDSQAIEWFEQAENKNYADKEMYLILAEVYRKRDNLSKELSALEYYSKNLDESNFEVNQRLFGIYYKISKDDEALSTWKRFDHNPDVNESLLEKYFQLNKKMDNKTVVDSVSLELLKIDPENVKALEWNAIKYYWKAENHYQSEMKKYEENKTGLQYVYLRNELKQVTADFKKALTYFDKLWKIEPGKKYASYMSNIYVRLDNKQKSDYYRSFLD